MTVETLESCRVHVPCLSSPRAYVLSFRHRERSMLTASHRTAQVRHVGEDELREVLEEAHACLASTVDAYAAGKL